VPESFFSSHSQVKVISNFVESSQVESQERSSHFESLVYKLQSMSSQTNFKLFLYIFGYGSTIGPSEAIGPPVDLQWL